MPTSRHIKCLLRLARRYRASFECLFPYSLVPGAFSLTLFAFKALHHPSASIMATTNAQDHQLTILIGLDPLDQLKTSEALLSSADILQSGEQIRLKVPDWTHDKSLALLATHTRVTTLVFSASDLTASQIPSIVSLLKGWPTLRHLTLGLFFPKTAFKFGWHPLPDASWNALFQAINGLTQLQDLQFFSSPHLPLGVASPNFSVLRLVESFTVQIADHAEFIIDSLAQYARSNPNLKSLKLGCKVLRLEDFQAFIQLGPTLCSKVTHLWLILSMGSFDAERQFALRLLPLMTKLTSLDVFGMMTPLYEHLLQTLASLSQLTHLRLHFMASEEDSVAMNRPSSWPQLGQVTNLTLSLQVKSHTQRFLPAFNLEYTFPSVRQLAVNYRILQCQSCGYDDVLTDDSQDEEDSISSCTRPVTFYLFKTCAAHLIAQAKQLKTAADVSVSFEWAKFAQGKVWTAAELAQN